jgi:RimJ/RimL family protein N-acetyltransferase
MRLETARLVIRTFEQRDAEPWLAMVGDPEVRRFLPPAPLPTLEKVELAYHFNTASWKKGYATEAAIGVLSHGLGPVGLDRAIALVVPENVGSSRVAEKAGMRFEGTGG